MALLEILEAPHPILSKKARPVRPDEFGPELERLVGDMAESMYAAPGVGLAAPQVGDARRILVADPGEEEEGRDGRRRRGEQFVAMVNPTLLEREGAMSWEESCLSVPEFYVDVQRFRRVKVAWQDLQGAPQERWYEDYAAIVIQHEMDHLEGVTLLDRASRLKRSRYIARKKKSGAQAELSA
jgi:peptide deformylase